MNRYQQAELIENSLSEFGVEVSYAFEEHRAGAEDIQWIFDGTDEDIENTIPFIIAPGKIYKVEEYTGAHGKNEEYATNFRSISKDHGDRLCRLLALLNRPVEVMITDSTFRYNMFDTYTIWIKVN